MNILVKEAKAKGMYLKDLAKELGVSLTAIQEWRAGNYKPNPKTARKMLSLGFSEDAVFHPDMNVE